MPSFKNINFSITDDVSDGDQSYLKALRSIAVAAPSVGGFPLGDADLDSVEQERMDEAGEASFIDPVQWDARKLATQGDEAATRFQLQTYLENADNEWMAQITSPERGELIPNMQLSSITASPDSGLHSVAYQQVSQRIPIFGARVAVDIDPTSKSLLAINGKVVPEPTISPIARFSPNDALRSLFTWAGPTDGADVHGQSAVSPPVLEWYLKEESQSWHLAYHFSSVFLKPRQEEDAKERNDESFKGARRACCGISPRSLNAVYDYFVDAHNGIVLFWFSSAPRASDIPIQMEGLDDASPSQTRKFFGRQAVGGAFALSDPWRNIETYDYDGANLDNHPQPPLPANPIFTAATAIGPGQPAAVSAHYHATLVFDFFNDVLKRKSIDDKGMKLVSVINVYSSEENPLPPTQWGNAVWWQNKMWYGTVNGKSFARHLDIIAHELTHGVTESSSNLIYKNVSGALNESFSDFFGVVIANWYPGEPNALSAWNWEIGSGLGDDDDGPIRDFSNPARTGQPTHWSEYRPVRYDEGGVHIYSGIHNKALYHLLTDMDASGNLLFPTAEAVLLVYYTLIRLTPTSDFKDSRRTLESVIRIHYIGNQEIVANRLAAVKRAFEIVGL